MCFVRVLCGVGELSMYVGVLMLCVKESKTLLFLSKVNKECQKFKEMVIKVCYP